MFSRASLWMGCNMAPESELVWPSSQRTSTLSPWTLMTLPVRPVCPTSWSVPVRVFLSVASLLTSSHSEVYGSGAGRSRDFGPAESTGRRRARPVRPRSCISLDHRDLGGGLVSGCVEPVDDRPTSRRCCKSRNDVIATEAGIPGRYVNNTIAPHRDDRATFRPPDLPQELAVRHRPGGNAEVEELSSRMGPPPQTIASQFVAGRLAQGQVIGPDGVSRRNMPTNRVASSGETTGSRPTPTEPPFARGPC